ncbi:hypothetical protein ABMA32_19005 [Mesorhizobium sp. VNQ89]|uniref:hypothetical protein n=1 Tax=Mesorhizobium quangtriensis TaxID=3157709 RepID=UPI0032B85CA7
MDAAELALRAIGGFYAFAAIVAIRAGAMGEVLTKALIAIKGTMTDEDRADRMRTKLLVVNSVLMGIGGVLLAALLDIALPVFLLSVLIYIAYILVIAPRYLDPYDPPDEQGRRQSRNAMWIYLGAAAFVVLGWRHGLLRPVMEESAAVLVIAALASAGIVGYAVKTFAPLRGKSPTSFDASVDSDEEPYDPEDDVPDKLVVTPSYGGGLIDADTGDNIGWLPVDILPQDKAEMVYAWSDMFRELADPHDPERRRLKDPARQAEIEEAGRPIYEWLLAQLGAERVSFEPVARPRLPEIFPKAIKVMADYGCDPLWYVDSEEVGGIYQHAMGISWSLAMDLGDWVLEFNGALNRDDPGGEPKWSEQQFADHSERGRALAVRLADELARTGRADIPVWFHGVGATPERVS